MYLKNRPCEGRPTDVMALAGFGALIFAGPPVKGLFDDCHDIMRNRIHRFRSYVNA